jgi:hypothetical protein
VPLSPMPPSTSTIPAQLPPAHESGRLEKENINPASSKKKGKPSTKPAVADASVGPK